MKPREASGPAAWRRKRSAPKREEGIEQIKARREKREDIKLPQARLTAFLQGPVATSKSFENQKGATEMAASSNQFIFIGPRGHLDGIAKNNNELPRVSFANVLKIRGCYEEGRQLISLHFYRVPWPPRGRAKRAEKKSF